MSDGCVYLPVGGEREGGVKDNSGFWFINLLCELLNCVCTFLFNMPSQVYNFSA